jgi:hypothetical protein
VKGFTLNEQFLDGGNYTNFTLAEQTVLRAW